MASCTEEGAAAEQGVAEQVPAYMIIEELAELVRAPVETVRYWRHIGKGPKSFKVGRRVLYAVEDVEAIIAAARNAEANVHAGGAA